MPKFSRRATIALSFALIASLVFGYVILHSWKYQTPVRTGETAPDIHTVTVSGQTFSLASLRGQPVMLDFFTPWCQPCIQETPYLLSFAAQYGSHIHVVLIDRGDGAGLVRQYVKKYGVPSNVTVLLDPNNHWSTPYGVVGQPESFFITASGLVTQHTVGPITKSRMFQYAIEAGMHTQ